MKFSESKCDVIFSNACLQWIENHHALLPDFMQNLHDGGILSVQMPKMTNSPLYSSIYEIAKRDK